MVYEFSSASAEVSIPVVDIHSPYDSMDTIPFRPKMYVLEQKIALTYIYTRYVLTVPGTIGYKSAVVVSSLFSHYSGIAGDLIPCDRLACHEWRLIVWLP